jgi:hypothetical protein
MTPSIEPHEQLQLISNSIKKSIMIINSKHQINTCDIFGYLDTTANKITSLTWLHGDLNRKHTET